MSFTECQVDDVTGDYVYKFIYPRLQSSDVFRLDFSLKGTNDADLSLSEFADETSYFHIVIGGWGNTKSAIECYKHCPYQFDMQSTPGIMSELEYRRFWLTYDHGTIKVGKGGEVTPFLEWHDETRRVTVNYIGITSFDTPATWIFYTFCSE
ncbi:C3 and PZP-like alpha-2-macroglobulin domain-containing protein 8 [Asterias amurensis]|uniref:C3 and PZP-like alpha-2-macroglobulin domain-containing protein 8 n=1 Tax=Asterias amurensis TaxID=7602 RepID=UPI003AB6378A